MADSLCVLAIGLLCVADPHAVRKASPPSFLGGEESLTTATFKVTYDLGSDVANFLEARPADMFCVVNRCFRVTVHAGRGGHEHVYSIVKGPPSGGTLKYFSESYTVSAADEAALADAERRTFLQVEGNGRRVEIPLARFAERERQR